MSDQRQRRKDDQPAKKEPAADAKKPGPAPESTPKPKYVFKIVPADPKNSINFEDTADK